MPEGQNTPDLQNVSEGQNIAELQTDKQRIELLNKEIFNKTQELRALDIDTISSVEFGVIEKEIRGYKAELDSISKKNNPDNAEQINQLNKDYANLQQIYNQLNQQLAQTTTALNQLSNDTMASQNQSEQHQETPEQNGSEEKGLKKWWHGLTKGQQVGVGLGGAAVGIGIFSLFRRRKKKKKGNSSESAGNKESFWDRPIGKVVKWTGIGTGIYYVVHGLSTGRRNPRDLFEWGKDKVDDSVSQVTAYEKLTQEQREQYEKIGNGVNDMYGKIWEREISMGFEDENVLGSISNKVKFKDGGSEAKYAGLVPFCIDKDSKNVREILSERNINEYLFNKNKSELINKLKGWSTDKLENMLGPFVDKLQSFQVFGVQPGASLGEKIKQWLDYNPDERKEELDFFFRQYSKVLVFLKDRETLLKYKVAENILKNTGYNGKSLPEDEDDKRGFIQEALEDDDWVKANIEKNNVYKNFMDSKLVSVNKILESQNIFNGEISAELQSRLDALDDDADDLLQIDENNNTVIDKGLNEIGGGLSDRTSKNLVKMCDDIQEDMVDGLGTGFFEEYFEWLTHLCNTEENNRQTFLQESGLLDIVDGMSSIMNEYKEKIQNKTITADDLQKLKQISVQYVAMKKEIEVAMYTMKSIKDDNPANSGFRILGSFCGAVQNIVGGEGRFGDWLTVGISISVVGGIIYVVKHPLKSGQAVMKAVGRVGAGGLHAAGRAGGRTLLTSRWLGGSIDRLASKGVPLMEQKKYLLYYVLNGKAHEESKIIRLASTKFGIEAKSGPDLIRQMCNLEMDQAEMAWKYSGDKNIRKLYMDSGTDWVHVRKRDVLLHHKATKSFEFDKNVLNSLKEIDSTIDGMDKAAGNGMKKLLKGVKEVEDLETLKVLAKNENFVNQLKTLDRVELRQFRKHLKEFRGEKLNKILTGELKIKDAVAPFMRNSGRQATRLAESTADVVPDLARPVSNVVGTTTDAASEAMNTQRKALEKHLDDTISRLRTTVNNAGKNERGLSRVPLKENALKRLESLRTTTQFTEEEAESFMKLIQKGFNVEYIDQLDSIFKLGCKFGKEGKIMGPELKRLLLAGKYDDFKNILINASDANKKVIKEAGINIFKGEGDDILQSLGRVFKIERGVGKVADDVIKAFARIVSKIF